MIMTENYIYLLLANGYKLKPFEDEKFQADAVISDFAFTTQEAADNFKIEWRNNLIDDQGFIDQAGFEIQISTNQIQLRSE